MQRKIVGNSPQEDLAVVRAGCEERVVERVPAFSSACRVGLCPRIAYQSVSSTTAVCPLKRGILSGTLPRSSTGITAKAPPPLASQFTEIYSGLALSSSEDGEADIEGDCSYLYQVRVPGIPGDPEVVVTLFLPMSAPLRIKLGLGETRPTFRVGRPNTWRYFDDRTNRPAMLCLSIIPHKDDSNERKEVRLRRAYKEQTSTYGS